MNPLVRHGRAAHGPLWVPVLVATIMILGVPALAQPKKGKGKRSMPNQGSGQKQDKADESAAPPANEAEPDRGKSRGKETVFDFTALSLEGSVRMPQLLYFLDRAQQELERASLERRSFIPELMKSLDEESL